MYDSLSPTADTAEFELVKEAVNLTCKRLDFQQFERFAIRAWFVTASKQQLGDLAQRVCQKFYRPFPEAGIPKAYRAKDVTYTVDFVRDGWIYAVRLGPMEKDQWFQYVYHERKVFEDASHGETFDKYAQAMPDHFIYADVDVSCENILCAEALGRIRRVCSNIRSLVQGLVTYVES